jgi:hypothetical protein
MPALRLKTDEPESACMRLDKSHSTLGLCNPEMPAKRSLHDWHFCEWHAKLSAGKKKKGSLFMLLYRRKREHAETIQCEDPRYRERRLVESVCVSSNSPERGARLRVMGSPVE